MVKNEPIKLYHIDRGKYLKERQKIILSNDYSSNPSDDLLREKIISDIKCFFPEGITRHGNSYLFSDDPTYTNNLTCEIVYEIIRRSQFPGKLSRMQSFFAFDEMGIQAYAAHWDGHVFEVEAAHVEKYDMNLVKNTGLATNSYFAHKYWNGESSDSPIYEYLLKPPIEIIRMI